MKPLPFTPQNIPVWMLRWKGSLLLVDSFLLCLIPNPLQRYSSSGSQVASDGLYENQLHPEEWVFLFLFHFLAVGLLRAIFPAIQHADAVSALTGKELRSHPSLLYKKGWPMENQRISLYSSENCSHRAPSPQPLTKSGGSITTRKVPGAETGDPKLAERFNQPSGPSLPPSQPASWRTSLPFSTNFQNSQPNISLCVFINSKDSRLAWNLLQQI